MRTFREEIMRFPDFESGTGNNFARAASRNPIRFWSFLKATSPTFTPRSEFRSIRAVSRNYETSFASPLRFAPISRPRAWHVRCRLHSRLLMHRSLLVS